MSEQGEGSPEDTEVNPPQVREEEEEDEEFEPFDEFHDEFKPVARKKISADGMPSVDAPFGDSDIPPLSEETLVCMGDTRSFVRRDEAGEIVKKFTKEEVTRLSNGKWYEKSTVAENPQRKDSFEVFPIRPPCKHYVRQLGLGQGQIKVTYRLCSARRTTEGAFMTVRDTGVWACTMREPRDYETEQKHLDEYDELKIRQGKMRVSKSIFSNNKKE